jgi:hypothetical protein
VPDAVEDPARRGVAAEPVLRDQRVDDDERRVGDCEPVGRGRLEGDPAPAPDDRGERGCQQHFLPGRDGVEREIAEADLPELRHDEVVQRQRDDERDQRPAWKAVSQRRRPGSDRG